jgi:hypothetical protein
MNREQIAERMKALQDAQKRLEAEIYQVSGAMADCNWWLNKILEEESKNAASEKHDA